MTLFLLTLWACTPSDESSSDSVEVEADTDTDTDADSDTDTDSDADTDTACDETDLVFVAQVRDATGNCSGCVSPIEASGVIQNRCDGPVTWRSQSGCVVRSATVRIKDGGDVHTESPTCDTAAKDWEIGAGKNLAEVAIPALGLGVGTYELVVTFNDGRPNEAVRTFAIE